MKCCIGFFVAFAIADCFIDEDAQRCRNTYFHIDMQVQLCRGPQNLSMCRCSCVQISISQRGRTEETAHAFQSTEHLVHLFLSFHLIFFKCELQEIEHSFFPLPELLLSQPGNLSSFSLLFISNPRYLQKNLPTSSETTKNRNLGIVHSSSFTQRRFDSMR